MTASSGYAPNGRLNSVAGGGAWFPSQNVIGEWLQVDLGETRHITGAMIQVRYGASHHRYGASHVKSYKLQYSTDGISWTTYGNSYVPEKVFEGRYELLSSPVDARFVRFYPQTWYLRIAMRVGVLGCNTSMPLEMEYAGDVDLLDEERDPLESLLPVAAKTLKDSNLFVNEGKTEFTDVYLADKPLRGEEEWRKICSDPLGMGSGAIPDSSITASSYLNDGYLPRRGRLNLVGSGGAWAPRYTFNGQWMEVDLGEMKRVTGTIIQGRHNENQWVTLYHLQYSTNRAIWTTYAGIDGSQKEFPGNRHATTNMLENPVDARYVRFVVRSYGWKVGMRVEILGCNTSNVDRTLPVTNLLDYPVDARYVRFLPQSWNGRMTMRVEIIGCPSCSTTRHLENGTLTWDLPEVNSSPFIFEVKVNTSGSGSGIIYLYRWGDNTTENQDGYRVELRSGQSQIERTTKDTDRETVASNYSTDITSAEEFRRFWICWSKGGSVGVGRAGEVEPFMSWTDPYPFIGYIIRVGYATVNVSGDFRFNCTQVLSSAAVVPVCPRLLGMESGDIPDGSITASSFRREASYTYGHEPYYGRLNAAPTRAWTAGYTFVGQWLQVDLGEMKLVMGTIVQGRLDHEERHWVFPGNVDMSIPVTNLLNNPVDARYVRFVVHTWNDRIAMRVEIVGCNSTAVVPACPHLLGMESGAIPDGSITASSFLRETSYSSGLEPHRGRLNAAPTHAWTARYNFVGQWLQVDLGERKLVMGTIIQGRLDHQDRYWVFPGNVDMSLPVTNLLDSPVGARYVRFVVQTWNDRIAMRVEIVGCNTSSKCLFQGH
ncbi:uncharacterized protein LOC118411098 [Branchiostoma floridae]|uniref:Uncharacterized protein LOC118411098 n=1 Tax=Branchiostoma floridae TaxID=7739 RepID=A0A9J7KR91_BRAFL|nr:uncharacterized protein LOC118411098 [Branchiostoma floridae]